MKKIILFNLIFILLIKFGYAENLGSMLEKGSWSPRASSLGFAYTAVADDATAIYFNPAGLSMAKLNDVSALTYRSFETNYLETQAMLHLDNSSTIAVGYIAANSGEIYQSIESAIPGRYELTGTQYGYNANIYYLGYSLLLDKNLAIGVTLKNIDERLADNTGKGFGADMGIMYQPWSFLKIGAVCQNIIQPRIYWNTGSSDLIYRRVKLGVSTLLDDGKLLLSLDTVYTNNLSIGVGAEYWLLDCLPLRMGYYNQVYLGTGLYLQNMYLDLGYTMFSDLQENSFKLALGLKF